MISNLKVNLTTGPHAEFLRTRRILLISQINAPTHAAQVRGRRHKTYQTAPNAVETTVILTDAKALQIALPIQLVHKLGP